MDNINERKTNKRKNTVLSYFVKKVKEDKVRKVLMKNELLVKLFIQVIIIANCSVSFNI